MDSGFAKIWLLVEVGVFLADGDHFEVAVQAFWTVEDRYVLLASLPEEGFSR